MEILTKSSGYILEQAPTYEQVLYSFRTAARNCYQSANESNNNAEATEKLVKALIKAGHCYDGDTEILTESGFIPFKKYNGEKVATVDPASREFVRFEYPKRIINDTYTGIIYDYSDTLGIKITDGHNLYGVIYKDTNSAHEYNYRLFKANSVGYEHSGDYRRIKTNGERKFWTPNSCKPVRTLDAYWELVGFWVGDGCRGCGGNALRFHLKKDRKINYLKSLADRLGMSFIKLANDNYKLSYPNIGKEFIEKYTLGSAKYLPAMDDVIAIYSIVHGLLNADGHITPNNSRIIFTTSVYVKDWLCSFSALAGIPTHLTSVHHPNNINHKTLYKVGICSSYRHLVNDSRKPNSFVKLVTVNNMPVYCVTVTTGLIVVRHGEYKFPVLCGNCSTLEFNNIPVHIVGDRNLLGQLSRHRLMSFCLSGDTIVQSFGKSGKKRTIRDLYKWYTTPRYHAAFSQLVLRSVNNSNIIIPNKPVKVFFNGNKDVYRVTTESGRSIKATPNHKFKTIDGWVELANLSVGDKLYVNGKELLNNEDWLRYNYLTLNHTRTEVAKLIGCCEAYVYKAFKKFDIVKPYKDFPNRKPGHGRKGMFTKEQRKEIGKRSSGANSHWYKADRNSLTRGGGYSEAIAKYGSLRTTGKCEFCNSTKNLEIHHVDKNPRHNNQDNIKILCRDCHNLWHGISKMGTFLDKIVSIEYVGVEDVYDIEMESSCHNYVADGFVVHNCVESARYNNYKNGIKVIVPHDMTNEGYDTWRASCMFAETAYLELLDKGCKPETARAVLPTCLATSVVCSANIREWRHIFEMRCDKHAQSDIRFVMLDLLKQFYIKYGVFFEDLYQKFVVDKE